MFFFEYMFGKFTSASLVQVPRVHVYPNIHSTYLGRLEGTNCKMIIGWIKGQSEMISDLFVYILMISKRFKEFKT